MNPIQLVWLGAAGLDLLQTERVDRSRRAAFGATLFAAPITTGAISGSAK
ncbi:MAG: hypothetical protein ACRDJL_02040 [Actinomycetota bacterium]